MATDAEHLRVLEAVVRDLDPKPTEEQLDAALAWMLRAVPKMVATWKARTIDAAAKTLRN